MNFLSVTFVLLALSKLSIELDLFCNFSFKKKVTEIKYAQDYACASIGLETRYPDIKVSAIFGTHVEGYSNADVHIVEFQVQKILYSPIDIAKFFPNIETFKIHIAGLQSIQRSNFKDMHNLKELSFFNNSLSEIPEDSFNDLTNLEELSLSENKIVKLEENLFRNMVNLRGVFLRNNKIEAISAKLFEANLKLEIIWLHNNLLIDIATQAFSHLPYLKTLRLENNACINKDYTFDENESLDELEKYFKVYCSESCKDLTNDLSNFIQELSQCEKEYENIYRENVRTKNQEKVCLIL